MKRIAFILPVVFLLLAACSPQPHGVMSEKKMSDVLYDMYLADGCVVMKGYTAGADNPRRKNYQFILHKYGITVAEFDSSVVWYAHNLLEYQKVYKLVETRLLALQTDINAGKYKDKFVPKTKVDTLDIWLQKRKYKLTADTVRTQLAFHYNGNQFAPGDKLRLTFSHKIDPVDKSSRRRIYMKVTYMNNKTDSLVMYTANDGRRRTFRLTFPLSSTSAVKWIDGAILAYDSVKGKQSAVVENIRFVRIVYPPKVMPVKMDQPKRKKHKFLFF
jgi:hypothetical protein